MSHHRLNLLRGLALAACLSAVVVAADEVAAPGKPQYGAWGFDSAGADFATHPGDNFFRYANGTWLDKTEIPGDKTGASLRIEMSDRIEARLHDMLETAAANVERQPATLEGKIGAFYKSFMDEARIETLRTSPLASQLARVRDAATRADLATRMGRTNVDFETSLFGVYVTADLKDPAKYAVYVTQSGLGLPDRDYYLQPKFAATKAAYLAHVTKVLGLLGWPEADVRAKEVVEFETKIAAASWTKVQQRDPVASYNPMTIAQLQKLTPGFAWKGFLASAGIAQVNRVIVSEKSAFPKIAAVYAGTSLPAIRAWLAFHITDNASPYPVEAFRRLVLRDARKDAGRPAGTASALEARHHGRKRQRPGRQFRQLRHAGLRRRPVVLRAVFPAERQGADRIAGRQPEGRLPRAYREAGLDGPGHEDGSAAETRHVHHQGGLSRSSARLLVRRHRQRRPHRQRASCGGRGLGVPDGAHDEPGGSQRLGDDAADQQCVQRHPARHRFSRPASCRRRCSIRPPIRPSITARSAA